MKKNIITTKLLIFIFFVLGILIFIILFKKDDNSYISSEINESEVVLYNQIINKAQSISDKKNCKQIKNLEIKSVCEASIDAKFDPMKEAQTLEDCKKLSATKSESKELRQDVCIYNLAIKTANNTEDISLCKDIIDTDLKDICESSISSKYDDMSQITTFE